MTLRFRYPIGILLVWTLAFSILLPLMSPLFLISQTGRFAPTLTPQIDQPSTNLGNTEHSTQSWDNRAPMDAPSPITNYTITTFLEDSTHIVNGYTTINYVNQADVSFAELFFHLYPNAFRPDGWMNISEVIYNSTPLSYTIMGVDQTVMEVDLVGGTGPGLLLPGEIVTLTITWQVLVPESQDRFGWYYRTEPFEFLGYNLGNWHPIIAVYDNRGWDTKPYSHMGESFYSDVAIYDVSITVPTDYIIAATGELHAINTGASTRSWNFQTDPVRDFTWCASPHYETESILVQSVNVTSYFVTDHTNGGQRVLEVAEECLDIYGNLFGSYPWQSLRVVESDIWAGGMEYPQLVMIGLPLYDYPTGLSSLAAVTAHEIGHEWIPFTLGTDSYTEPWIDEGFASFCEYVWVEYVYGAVERADYRQNDLDNYWEYVEMEGDKCVNQSMSYWQSTNWLTYGRIVYAKGALVYDMFRHQLGNSTFYEGWHYIYSEVLHQNLRTRTLQQLFEDVVNESLDWFFDPWVHGSGVITISFGHSSVQQDISGWILDFQIKQYQSIPIRLRVPIGINYGVHSEVVWIWVGAQETSHHTLLLSELPLQLTLDPDHLLLCQYQNNIAILALAPGSPISLVVGGVIGVVIVASAIVLYRRRQHP